MTSTDNKEKELIYRIVSGDRVAAREFYDNYSGYLTAVCHRYLTSRDDVRDVLQESFIKIFGSIGRFEYRGSGSLRAWAVRIVVNEALKYLKSRNRLRGQILPDSLSDPAEDADADFENVPMTAILEMIRSLPDGYRTVFNLYVFENKSHREIASMLDIGESTSASQLHRARCLLAKQIKNTKYE